MAADRAKRIKKGYKSKHVKINADLPTALKKSAYDSKVQN